MSFDIKIVFVRTKTGNKVHAAYGNSSRTLCGCKVAMRIKKIAADMPPCHGCGMSDLTIAHLASK